MAYCKAMNKKVKKLDCWDYKLIKLAVVAGVLFLITVWPGLHDLVMRVHWGWYLAIAIILALRPMRVWCKK